MTKGYGGWCFDMWGGWFSDPDLLNVLNMGQHFFKEYPPQEEINMNTQVCVIVDEELSFWDASFGKLTEKILVNRYPLGKTGAPYDLYLRTDLSDITINDYRVIWLMGILKLNEEEIKQIEKWKQKGIMVLWTDGTGTRIYNNDYDVMYFQDKFKWSNSELRELWKNAGVHIYLETNDVLYVGRKWICIHTVEGGQRTLKFPFYDQVIDPLNKKIIADSTNFIETNLAPRSTTLFRVNSF